METSEIRDAMLKKQALYEQSVKMADKAAVEMMEQFAEIDDKDLAELHKNHGIDVRWVKTIDYIKLRNDTEYQKMIKEKQEKAIMQLHSMLEEALNV
ncbi:hypothetical protein AALB53_08330 [Lachnospiraceae bacterium 47-T17]